MAGALPGTTQKWRGLDQHGEVKQREPRARVCGSGSRRYSSTVLLFLAARLGVALRSEPPLPAMLEEAHDIISASYYLLARHSSFIGGQAGLPPDGLGSRTVATLAAGTDPLAAAGEYRSQRGHDEAVQGQANNGDASSSGLHCIQKDRRGSEIELELQDGPAGPPEGGSPRGDPAAGVPHDLGGDTEMASRDWCSDGAEALVAVAFAMLCCLQVRDHTSKLMVSMQALSVSPSSP